MIVAKGGHIVSGSSGGGGGSSELLMHPQTLSSDIVIPDFYNAHLIGPIGLNMTLTVGASSVLSILEN